MWEGGMMRSEEEEEEEWEVPQQKQKPHSTMWGKKSWWVQHGGKESCESFFEACAIFGEVEGWLLLFRAMWMTFHMRRGSIRRVFFRGRDNNQWCWHVIIVCCTGWCWRATSAAPHSVLDLSYLMIVAPRRSKWMTSRTKKRVKYSRCKLWNSSREEMQSKQ